MAISAQTGQVPPHIEPAAAANAATKQMMRVRRRRFVAQIARLVAEFLQQQLVSDDQVSISTLTPLS